jgi:hypothetical protein
MARTADFQRIVTEEISVELADGVSLEEVQQALDDLPPLRHFDEIKDATEKVLAIITYRDHSEDTWERTDEGGD